MQCLRHTLLCLGVLYLMGSAALLGGCTSTSSQPTADDVNNKAFTFADGAVFHAGLARTATILEFTNKANTFILTSQAGSATGTVRFGSCILTVTGSTYTTGAGPQAGEVITLDPCDFDDTNRTLTVAHGGITATSQPALAQVVTATAADLNNRSFLFSNGAVFHTALTNLVTTLRFADNATTFTLSSTTNTATNTAKGGHSFGDAGSCILTVTSSDYSVSSGPQVGTVIRLTTCQFNSSTGFLILSDGKTTISSI